MTIVQGMITQETPEDFGISTSITSRTHLNPDIVKWTKVIDEAITTNNSLSQIYQLEVIKGYDFIRVNLRNKYNWVMIRNLIIISIKHKASCVQQYSNKVKEILIIIDEINQFTGINKELADECVNTAVYNFLRDYSYQ